MINPKTYPDHFRTVPVAGHRYAVPKFISMGLQESMAEAHEADYRRSRPEELVGGAIDPALFEAWLASREGKRVTNRSTAGLLFVPLDGAPPVTDPDIYGQLGLDVFGEALNFFSLSGSDKSESLPKSEDSSQPVQGTATISNA